MELGWWLVVGLGWVNLRRVVELMIKEIKAKQNKLKPKPKQNIYFRRVCSRLFPFVSPLEGGPFGSNFNVEEKEKEREWNGMEWKR